MESVFEGHVDTKETTEEVITRFELYAYTTPFLIYSVTCLINKYIHYYENTRRNKGMRCKNRAFR